VDKHTSTDVWRPAPGAKLQRILLDAVEGSNWIAVLFGLLCLDVLVWGAVGQIVGEGPLAMAFEVLGKILAAALVLVTVRRFGKERTRP
jgi:hypothetical protein